VNHTRTETECKDCCDSLDTDGASRKACRDACPKHDFTQNTAFVTVEPRSLLGPGGDYSLCVSAGDEQACKACCDDSAALQAGDRRFCRDTCAGTASAGNPPAPKTEGNGGPPPQKPGQGGSAPVNPKPDDPPQSQPPGTAGKMTLEQAISDEAQRNTIAFDGLAFLTGNLGADSFFPPGKVADFWGFQYLRDNDPSAMGHNTDFLTKASLNMLAILTAAQKARLVALAKSQVQAINEYGYRRFVLLTAFRRLLAGDLPTGASQLSEEAVKNVSSELYRLDGRISLERAQVMGGILHDLSAGQTAALAAMAGTGMTSWPDAEEPAELRPLSRDEKIAVMTYAGDLFSWQVGSVEADVYFCPERHGTYFGSFYLKDAPAVGNPGYSIGTNITADMGKAFIETLTPEQAQSITSLVDVQRPFLAGIVEARRRVSIELRKFMAGEAADNAAVLSQMAQYGELDGSLAHSYAVHFAQIAQTLTDAQKARLMELRWQTVGDYTPKAAFLYAEPIDFPEVPNTDFLFK
jgi:Spy/CpxP family protein refolding chaperone